MKREGSCYKKLTSQWIGTSHPLGLGGPKAGGQHVPWEKRRLHAWSPASGAPSARGEAADSPAEAKGVSSRMSQHCVKAAGPEPTTVISCPVKLRGRPKHREDVGALLLQAHRRKPTQTFPGVLRSSDLHRQLGVASNKRPSTAHPLGLNKQSETASPTP